MGMSRIARIGTGLGLMAVLSVGLSACQDGGFTLGRKQTAKATPVGSGSIELVERDVEAPEVFDVTTQALWDGRPSLGGVWVAHVDSKQPERVIIRNLSNGKFVIGALFRRERNNPGPDLQLSSDAAAALEVQAGTPTKLQVTVLRRETVNKAEPVPTEETKPAKGETVTTAEITPIPTETLEATAIASVKAAEKAKARKIKTEKPKAPAQKAKAPVAKSKIKQPYVQIGFFSVESNATANVAKMKANGIPAKSVKATAKDKTFWRVVAGPAGSKSEKKQLLTMIKKLGFSDAYYVSK